MDRAVLVMFLFMGTCVHAQVPVVDLLPKQLFKIEQTQDVRKKLKLYRKYIHKDSIRYLKKLDKFWEAQSDSMRCALSGVQSKANERLANLRKELEGRIPAQDKGFSLSAPNSIERQSLQMPGVVSDVPGLPCLAGGTEKLNELAGEYLPAEINKAGEYGKYTSLLTNTDTLKSIAVQEANTYGQELITKAGASKFDRMKSELPQANHLKSQFNGLQTDLSKYADSTYLRNQIRKRAEQYARQFFQNNPHVLRRVQRKMGLLMRKYSVVPNSNDLSSAVKLNSLKGKSFRERIMFGLNFQVPSLDPVMIDFSPVLGYKINSQFQIGVGGTYRQQINPDSIPDLEPSVLGYKFFSTYQVFGQYFVLAEFDRNTTAFKNPEVNKQWDESFLAGAGRKFSVHRKVDMTVVFLYNFMHDSDNLIDPRPWIVRVGFQTSELAMMKRRPPR